jgi:hypothetical protein
MITKLLKTCTESSRTAMAPLHWPLPPHHAARTVRFGCNEAKKMEGFE